MASSDAGSERSSSRPRRDSTRGGDADNDGCRNCGEVGHFARECPEPRQGGGACFNCGEEGHNKADCPNPRVFKGACRHCGVEGHPAAECPDKPAEVCKNCKKEGHKAGECTEPRAIDRSDYEDLSSEEAWKKIVKADNERDLDDLRDAIETYAKAVGKLGYDELEANFRKEKFNTYIIALQKEVTDTYTIMDLNGTLDREFVIGYFFSANPQRTVMKEGWPETPEVNSERLKNAGVPVDRGVPKCNNCGKLGHVARSCPEEKVEAPDRIEVKCVNCDEVGHRARDCTQPRKSAGRECRNCGQVGHKASDCTEPRSAANVECNVCGETGHFAKDCPTKPAQMCRNCGEEGHLSRDCEKPRQIQCRNCDEMGHMSRDCPKPRDYSRVQCQNCGEMGHTKVRCKQPPKEDEEEGLGDFNAMRKELESPNEIEASAKSSGKKPQDEDDFHYKAPASADDW